MFTDIRAFLSHVISRKTNKPTGPLKDLFTFICGYTRPEHLSQETLITYPVEIERQDIYRQFLMPANRCPKKRKVIETTDIMLHMVIAGRGIAALPDWLVLEYARTMPITSVRLGQRGIAKQIFLGIRKIDADTDYLSSFLEMADHSDG